jgi:transcriptional regulator with XRE-family HTH domain
MFQSTITKHSRVGRGSELGRAIGAELRRRRHAAQLTQSDLGEPFSRSFISAVERGHTVPSVGALAILTDRLGISLDEFFVGVKRDTTIAYNPPDGDHDDPSPRHR